MDESKRIAGNSLLIFSSYIVRVFCSFILTAQIIRFLGNSNYGIFSLAWSIVELCFFGWTIGLSIPYFISSTEKVSRLKNLVKFYFRYTLSIMLVPLFFVFLFADKLAVVFGIPQLSWVLRVFVLITPLWTIYKSSIKVFYGLNRIKQFSFLNSLENVSVIFSFILVLFLGFAGIVYGQVFRALVLFGFSLVLLCKVYPFKVREERVTFFSNVKKVWGYNKWVVFYGIVSMFSFQIPSAFIAFFTSTSEVAFYSIAFSVAGLLTLFASSASTALFPEFASGNVKSVNKRLVKYLLIFSVPFFVYFLLFAEVFISFVYGSGVAAASTALRAVLFSTLITSMFVPLDSIVKGINKPSYLTFSVVPESIVLLLSCLVLIPFLGSAGAGIGLSLSTLVHYVIILFLMRKKVSYNIPLHLVIKVLLASFIGLIPALFLSGVFHFISLIVISIPVFLKCFSLLKGFDNADRRLFYYFMNRAGLSKFNFLIKVVL